MYSTSGPGVEESPTNSNLKHFVQTPLRVRPTLPARRPHSPNPTPAPAGVSGSTRAFRSVTGPSRSPARRCRAHLARIGHVSGCSVRVDSPLAARDGTGGGRTPRGPRPVHLEAPRTPRRAASDGPDRPRRRSRYEAHAVTAGGPMRRLASPAWPSARRARFRRCSGCQGDAARRDAASGPPPDTRSAAQR